MVQIEGSKMKIIIAGPRDRSVDFKFLDEALKESGFELDELVCGMAYGIDTSAFEWANWCGFAVKEFPAKWEIHGRAAGPIRNTSMARYADALIAIWDGKSKGTGGMIKIARLSGLKVFVKYLEEI